MTAEQKTVNFVKTKSDIDVMPCEALESNARPIRVYNNGHEDNLGTCLEIDCPIRIYCSHDGQIADESKRCGITNYHTKFIPTRVDEIIR